MSDYSALVNEIDEKYKALNQKTEAYLEGLLWSKPITYGIIFKQMRF